MTAPPLPNISGEFAVLSLDLKFSENGKDKNNAWLKIRGKAADSVRDSNGAWTEGPPLFIDIIVNNGAAHLFESVVKGDNILVNGKLKQREYEVDGQKRVVYQIHAQNIGVSTRWAPARTQRAIEDSGVSTVQATLGGEVIEDEAAPF